MPRPPMRRLVAVSALPPKASVLFDCDIAEDAYLAGKPEAGVAIVWRKAQAPALDAIGFCGFDLAVYFHGARAAGAEPLATCYAALVVWRLPGSQEGGTKRFALPRFGFERLSAVLVADAKHLLGHTARSVVVCGSSCSELMPAAADHRNVTRAQWALPQTSAARWVSVVSRDGLGRSLSQSRDGLSR